MVINIQNGQHDETIQCHTVDQFQTSTQHRSLLSQVTRSQVKKR